MNALVLSGGNIKGAYQAGAIAAVLESGFVPGIITGISIGGIHAAWLAAHQPPTSVNWPMAGVALTEFWRTKVTKPSQFVRKRNVIELAYRFLFNKWAGLVSTAPLEKLIRAELTRLIPPAGPVDGAVGATNLRTGDLEWFSSQGSGYLDAVLASAAEPIGMPLRPWGKDMYYDGGLRDITPLKKAIGFGATRIIAIVCQPEHDAPEPGNTGNIMYLLDRVSSIITNEIVNNDIEVFKGVNDLLAGWALLDSTKRYIPLTVIRPAAALGASVMDFTSVDITRLIAAGRADATTALALEAAA